ncbi:MAG: UTP--glucose-1-phosphate uridylyltransferase [Clostridia bacterium]|nr:UTP--glucose-1-phosphate uridylyltransferase [Clostridia bacterium]
MTAREKCQKYGQEHLLQYENELSPAEKEELYRQILEADFDLVGEIKKKEESTPDFSGLTPLGALEVPEIREREEEFRKAGIEAIRQGKIAALLLGGGQGTRLGFDGPKGTFDFGVTHPYYIFQAPIETMLRVGEDAGCAFPLCIMTSDKNDEATRAFLKEKNYFGFPEEKITFFRQAMAPSCDFNGKIYLEGKGQLSLSPNGNGGWFKSLVHHGLDKKLAQMGVEWINVFAVDNVLQKICDPVFVGATVLSGTNCGAKVIRKNAPKEKVGALCLKDGLPTIVEYYELSDELANLRDESGELTYRFGVILNYLFKVSRMQEVVNGKLPLHIVKKKIPHLDENGELVKPTEDNGFKVEYLATDNVRDMLSCIPFEVVREQEFAPIKNPEGIDSVVSARELMQKNGFVL